MRKQAIYKQWDSQILKEMYLHNTAKEMSKSFNVSVSTIRRALKYYSIKKEHIAKDFIEMEMTIYFKYKNLTIDISGNMSVSKQKYNSIENKPQYIFAVLYNHIHGQGKTGLQKMVTMCVDDEMIQSGYDETPIDEPHPFQFTRFIVNGRNYASERNDNLIKNSKLKNGDENDNV